MPYTQAVCGREPGSRRASQAALDRNAAFTLVRVVRRPHRFGHQEHQPVHDVERRFLLAPHAMPGPYYHGRLTSRVHHFRQTHIGLERQTGSHRRPALPQAQ